MRGNRECRFFEAQLSKVPEDARARVLLAGDYAVMGRIDDATHEANMAMALRPNDAIVMYNVVLHVLHARQERGSVERAAQGVRRRLS